MKLKISRAYGARLFLLLVTVACCLFQFMLHRQCETFREYEAAFLSLQSLVMACLGFWCASFIWLTFNRQDLPLIGLLIIAIGFRFLDQAVNPSRDALTLLAGVTLGKGARFALKSGNWKADKGNFFVGLIIMLAFAAWWRLDMSGNYYSGPRWMGLWDNPNTYGMLMGAGVTLAIGLLAASLKSNVQRPKLEKVKIIFLSVAIFMLGVGLVMSYSRGAWLATAIGLLYLAWCYGKLKWKYVAIGAGCVALAAGLLWGGTADSAPWYLKRADLGRPSAQHRATAWRAGLEIMRDYPLGVGWNNAIRIYGEKYHPPEGGPAAITTNDYMILGTELGIPALLCFVVYVGLCYRKGPRPLIPAFSPGGGEGVRRTDEGEALRAACLAGALVFVVAFWFDGGLFKLPTAALFWVLLELGSSAVPVRHCVKN